MDDAEQFALDKTQDFISSYPNLRKYDIVETGKTLQWKLNSTVGDAEGAMFPVWFMAYKNKDRVAYATVNGQTGKVVADLPVDVPKYLGASVVLTIPLFFLLNAFLTLIPSMLLGIVCLVAGIVSCMYFRQIDDIAAQEGKEYDKGAIAARLREQRENHKRAPGGEKLPPKSDAQLAASLEERKKEEADAKPKLIVNGETVSAESDSFRAAMTFFDLILVLAVVAAGLLFGFVLEEYFTRITVGAAAVLVLIYWFRTWFRMDDVSSRKGRGNALTYLLIPMVASVIVALLHPVSDLYYYGCIALMLLAMVASLVDLIRCYNLFATRPLPQFHYKGGDDRA